MADNIEFVTPGDLNRVLGVVDHPVNLPVWAVVEHCPLPRQSLLVR